MPPVFILDNGASSIKAGFPTSDAPRIVSNAIVKPKGASNAKLYIGHEIESCKDFFGLYYRRPFEKGILTDWDVEKAIWDKLFSPDGMDLTTRSASLLLTEPPFNLPSVQETYDQLVFEEYEFKSYMRCPPAALIPHGDLFASEEKLPAPECCIIVDSGFSFTHIIPIMNGSIQWASVRRIDIGGKLLTNHLKEIVSFRHWDMMEHYHVMNQVKEACCYVSETFEEDLEVCQSNPRRNPIVQEYMLPDFSINRPGYIRAGPGATSISPPSTPPPAPTGGNKPSEDPVLYMSNERFAVPEVLFHPLDVGLNQAGLAEGVAASIASLPEDLRGLFWANIGLVGGNICMPGVEGRLRTELRALAPPEATIGIYKASNPITASFSSAQTFAQSASFPSFCVTKEEYEEYGSNICRRRFGREGENEGRFGAVLAGSASSSELVAKEEGGDDDAMDIDEEGGSGNVSGSGSGGGTGVKGKGKGRRTVASGGMSAKEAKIAALNAKAKAAETKTLAEKESRAARMQARGSKK